MEEISTADDEVRLGYTLSDPEIKEQKVASMMGPYPGAFLSWGKAAGGMDMYKIGEDTYKCILPKVFVQFGRTDIWEEYKHKVEVYDRRRSLTSYIGENIDIPGSYDREIKTFISGSFLHFKMSNKLENDSLSQTKSQALNQER